MTDTVAAASTRVDSWRVLQYVAHVWTARLTHGVLAGPDETGGVTTGTGTGTGAGTGAGAAVGAAGADSAAVDGGMDLAGSIGLSRAVLARIPLALRAKLKLCGAGRRDRGRGRDRDRDRGGSGDSVESAEEGTAGGHGPTLEDLISGLTEAEVGTLLDALTADPACAAASGLITPPIAPLSGWVYSPLRGSNNALYERPMLPVPLYRLSLSEVLGAVTFVTFVDDEVSELFDCLDGIFVVCLPAFVHSALLCSDLLCSVCRCSQREIVSQRSFFCLTIPKPMPRQE